MLHVSEGYEGCGLKERNRCLILVPYLPLINMWYKGQLFTYLCHLLITFANSLDPDQAQQNVGPDLNLKLFNTLMVFLKEFFIKVDFEKNQQTTKKKHEKLEHIRWRAIANPHALEEI